MHRISYKLLLLLSISAAVCGIITLLPDNGASYPNTLRYSSVCTFTPASSLFCFLIAGLSCFFRSTFIKDQSGNKKDRFKKHRKSLIPLSVLLAAAVFSTVLFSIDKKTYTDAGSSASVIKDN